MPLAITAKSHAINPILPYHEAIRFLSGTSHPVSYQISQSKDGTKVKLCVGVILGREVLHK